MSASFFKSSTFKKYLCRVIANSFAFFSFFSFSLYFLSLYVGGDQLHYSQFYEGSSGLSYFDAYLYARDTIGASDPLSIFFLWLGSWLGIPKSIYVSIWNSLFLLILLNIFRKHSVSWFLYPFLFSNFYILVLLTGAERLKFGFIFLALSICFSSRFFWFSLLISFLSHFQMLLLAPSMAIRRAWPFFLRALKTGRVAKKIFPLAFISVLLLVVLFYCFRDALLGKFLAYYRYEIDFSYAINVFVLFLCSIFVSKDWKRMFVSFLPFFVLVLLLGDSRINILAVFFVFWVFISERRLAHPVSLSLILYFTVKSFGFIYNVYHFGNGFA